MCDPERWRSSSAVTFLFHSEMAPGLVSHGRLSCFWGFFFPKSLCFMVHIPPETLHTDKFASAKKCVRRINASAKHSIAPFSSQSLTFVQFGKIKIALLCPRMTFHSACIFLLFTELCQRNSYQEKDILTFIVCKNAPHFISESLYFRTRWYRYRVLHGAVTH